MLIIIVSLAVLCAALLFVVIVKHSVIKDLKFRLKNEKRSRALADHRAARWHELYSKEILNSKNPK